MPCSVIRMIFGWITRSKFCMMQFKAILPMNRWSAIPSLICGFPKPESRVWVRILNSTVHSIIYYSITGGIQGCAAIFNKKAGEYLMNYRGRDSMHDHLLNIVGLAFGKVFSIDLPLMLYRQHGDNQTGISRYNYSLWRRILLGIKMREPVIDKRHYETIQDFYAQYRSVLPDEKRRVFEAYLNMPLLRLFSKNDRYGEIRFQTRGVVVQIVG